jgi:CheY-like chemotaxis protein
MFLWFFFEPLFPMTKILLAEDDTFLRKISKAKLEKDGYTVLAAEDGKQALAELKNKPDLILLDVIMPFKNGFEVLKAIRKDKKLDKVPVIMLTTLSQESDMDKAKKMGADDYINKANASVVEIGDMVKKYLKKK